MKNRYPIYILSKGRWDRPFTARSLEEMGAEFTIVVEPQEADKYRASVQNPDCVAVLPFRDRGAIPTRNWIWEHSMERGAERHWILDDNIDGFYRLHQNRKIRFVTPTCFRAAEDFVDRYENIAIAGFQYAFLAMSRAPWPAFTLNTRIYSCILIQNSIPYRWRGTYNADTDLSLCALKGGWCTVLFYAFLAAKLATMGIKGGNTDRYHGDGRWQMAESLRLQHPDVTEVVKRWGRWQHLVNYRPFKNNQLVMKPRDQWPEASDYKLKVVKRDLSYLESSNARRGVREGTRAERTLDAMAGMGASALDSINIGAGGGAASMMGALNKILGEKEK